MSYQEIIYTERHGVVWITLNRPGVMNAISMRMLGELEDAIRRIQVASGIRVVVLTGAGKAFCAGADLKEFSDSYRDGGPGVPDFPERAERVCGLLRSLSQPVIAGVNGFALAGGLELVMCCDLVIAAESAKIGDVHANFGVFPGAGGAAVLPRKVGPNRAKYLLFTGDMLPASELLAFGLVNEVVPDGDLMAALERLIAKLASKSPLLLRRMKEVANAALDQDQAAALRHEMLLMRHHLRSYDLAEGLKAFAEKRKPEFQGK
jgi:enoyl-CoA hydratase/carnithine racemase